MLTQKKSTTECHSTAILQYSRASPVPLYCRISHLWHALKQKPRLPAPSMAGTGPGCPSEEKMSPSQNTKAEMVSCYWLGESCTRKNVFSYSWAWQQHRVPGRALILCTEPERCQPLLSQNNGFGGDIGSGPGGIHRAAGDGRAKTLQQPVPTVNELTGLIKKGCVQCSACIRKGWGQGRAQRPPLGWGPMFFIFRSVQYKPQVSEIWCDFIPRYFYSKLKAASNGENKPSRVCLVNSWEQRRHLQHIGDVRAWPKAATREIHCRITRSAQSTEQGHEIFPLRNPCPTEGNNETLIACREKGNNSSVCSAGREGTLPGVQPIQPVINTL